MADEVLIDRRQLLALASAGALATAGCTDSQSETGQQAQDPEFGYGSNPVTTRLDQSDALAGRRSPGEDETDERDPAPPSSSPSPPPFAGGGDEPEEGSGNETDGGGAPVTEPLTYEVVLPEGSEYVDSSGGSSVTVVGEVVDLRDASAVECWFRYRRVGEEPPRATDVQTLGQPGTFEAELSPLQSGAIYDVWALAAIGDETFAGSIGTISLQ